MLHKEYESFTVEYPLFPFLNRSVTVHFVYGYSAELNGENRTYLGESLYWNDIIFIQLQAKQFGPPCNVVIDNTTANIKHTLMHEITHQVEGVIYGNNFLQNDHERVPVILAAWGELIVKATNDIMELYAPLRAEHDKERRTKKQMALQQELAVQIEEIGKHES